MLIDETHHPETVRNLLRGSLEERYRFISNVDQNEYLDDLMIALDESDKYEGIYCQPIRKYKSEADASESADDETRHETYSETYLDDLRDAQMGEKTRVFVIDPEDEDDMEEDLDNSALMDYYWENSGEDVKSYWITTSEYKAFYGEIPNVPEAGEFSIFDEQLLIEYDEFRRTLHFDTIQSTLDDSIKREVFMRLEEQLEHGQHHPFKKIEPPSAHM